jgi:hypothetical protein
MEKNKPTKEEILKRYLYKPHLTSLQCDAIMIVMDEWAEIYHKVETEKEENEMVKCKACGKEIKITESIFLWDTGARKCLQCVMEAYHKEKLIGELSDAFHYGRNTTITFKDYLKQKQ